MPRMISTSFMTGTGFMKCMPMNFSGRSVAAPSRVMEIDEVFDGQQAGRLQMRRQRLEDRALDLLLFGRRLDHQVGVGEGRVVAWWW